MGVKIVSGVFATSVISLVQHGRASMECILCGHHIYKQICQPLVGELLTLELLPWQICCQSPQGCYCHWPCSSRVFAGALALPQARRDHHLWSYRSKKAWSRTRDTLCLLFVGMMIQRMKILTKLLPSTSSAVLFVLRTTWHALLGMFAWSSKFVY